ncbi:hypothetical protein HA41_11155 [Pantoea conspicua]|uniref:Uncharacterized protein n=1 Tax=Pantoea conspicua TaxID=472705 RepID=A0A1X1BVS1_9GAMM|nr:hypothetical protein [Pantoea conspicua]ORM52633.1 hypothetical protein HA41_11155 [Pantoea conspicua]
MPRENKYLKLEELEAYAYANGAELNFYPPTGVFTMRDRKDIETWVWVINPYTKERVKRVRELDKTSWIFALQDALERLKAASGALLQAKSDEKS